VSSAFRIVLLIAAQLLALPVCAQATESFSGSMQQMLASATPPYVHSHDRPQAIDKLRALYGKHDFAPLWRQSGRPTAQALQLLQVMRAAEAYGLHAREYDTEWIDTRLREPAAAGAQPARSAELDLALASAALRFVTHLHYGRVDPRLASFRLPAPRADLDVVSTLEKLARTADTRATLEAIEPDFYHYRLLKDALARYRTLAGDQSLAPLPAFNGRSVGPGQPYTGAPAMRRLLLALGDLDGDAAAPPGNELLDDALVAALRRFQERHGLAADGALGKRTFAALNVPLAQRVRQIELTLERWRWLPEFATPPIVVNLPEFRLFALRSMQDRESDILRMDVIVGQSYPRTRTPIFVAEMKYVMFRPYWDVPDSIVAREMLPDIRSRPGFLERNHLELVRGESDDSPVVPPTPENMAALAAGELRMRQQPGEDNALGAIKFMLPNPYNVYLHSTPAQHLFRESRRAFSHGCIRVSDPVALAAHVLRNAEGDWTVEKINAAMNGAPNQRVNLVKPIQVMILYGTVMAAESGQVFFFEDIYGHDRKLERLLRLQNE
jgi:murein L,D-transpeptidase YcbB/YkuD